VDDLVDIHETAKPMISEPRIGPDGVRTENRGAERLNRESASSPASAAQLAAR
jgi:hypothetical protein